MELNRIIKLFESSNNDDVLIAYEILMNKYNNNLDRMNKLIHPWRIVRGYDSPGEDYYFIKVGKNNNWLQSDWIKIDRSYEKL